MQDVLTKESGGITTTAGVVGTYVNAAGDVVREEVKIVTAYCAADDALRVEGIARNLAAQLAATMNQECVALETQRGMDLVKASTGTAMAAQ